MNDKKDFLYRDQNYRLIRRNSESLKLEKQMTKGIDRIFDVTGPWSLTGLFEIQSGSICFHINNEIFEVCEPLVGVSLPAWSLTEISGNFESAAMKLIIKRDSEKESEKPKIFKLNGTTHEISREIAPSYGARQIKKAIEKFYLDENSMKELAHSLGMKESTFSLCFSRSWRLSPKQYQTRLRIHHSLMEMISAKDSDRRIIDTAFDSGFQDLSRFNKQFRAIMDLRPKDIMHQKWQSDV